MGPLQTKAAAFAKEAHKSTNHTYDGKCYYEEHVKAVVAWAEKFIHLAPDNYKDFLLAVCEGHDTIEDCRVTYNDWEKAVNEDVAEGIFLMTNLRGRNREERANNEYYEGIVRMGIVFVKVCDRLANVSAAKNNKHSMLVKYKKEQKHFRNQLDKNQDFDISEMWDTLEELLK